MTGEPARQDNHAINALRTLAAGWVVIGHLRILVMADYDDVPHTPINLGVYGVTALGHQAVIVFFVLSGYWVGGTVLRRVSAGRFVWQPYLVQRLTRLWVVLIPALALTAALDLLGRHLWGEASVYAGTPGYAGVVLAHPHPNGVFEFLGNTAFLQLIRVDPYGTNSALWSLSYEFWFYVLFPLLVCVVAWRERRLLTSALGLLTLAICVFVGTEILWYFPIWCVGALVAVRNDWLKVRLSRAPTVSLAILRLGASGALLITAVTMRMFVNDLPLVLADYIVAIPSAMLLALLVTDAAPRGLNRIMMRGLSRYAHNSYSLYAIHTPIVIILTAAIGIDVGDRWPSDVHHWAMFLGLLVVPVVAGCLFANVTEHHTDEARRAVSKWLPKRPSRGSQAGIGPTLTPTPEKTH